MMICIDSSQKIII